MLTLAMTQTGNIVLTVLFILILIFYAVGFAAPPDSPYGKSRHWMIVALFIITGIMLFGNVFN